MKDLFELFNADDHFFCKTCERIQKNEDARYSDDTTYYSNSHGLQMDEGELEGCQCGASWKDMQDVDFEIFVKHGESIGW